MMHLTPKILVLDQDRLFSHQLHQALTADGHLVVEEFSGEPGLLRAVSEKFDLILLNLDLPQMDALAFLRSLRQSRATPVVIMDAGRVKSAADHDRTDADASRIEAFRLGADDYWVKPLSDMEMRLRVAAILRRTCGWNSGSTVGETLQVGPLRLNRRELKVQVNQKEVELTQVQFKLLWYLASHQHQVLPKAYLHTLVLEKPYSRHDRSIDMHLSRVRKKLTDVGLTAGRVQTVHGKGYCFA
jgi:two-component system response regulator PfeR